MKYKIEKDKIIIFDKQDFNPTHILECGQIFCYSKSNEGYVVYSKNKKAEIVETKDGYEIITDDALYFEKFFDLKTDYGKIKNTLSKFDVLKNPISFGHGIRILKNDLFEVLISFIISANNNIKRIQLIINRLKQACGERVGNYFAFPTYEMLLKCDKEFFTKIGCGYRADYLYKVLRQITPDILESWRELDTECLRKNLISLAGVGPKVADCILLFGYSKTDVFPVDTWIAKVYNQYFDKTETNRVQIRKKLVAYFKNLSGYAQQYLFYSAREK